MRQIYASPRPENIDRAVALLAERGIAARVMNRSAWKRSSYQRFSYQASQDSRDDWAQVWVLKADDYAAARRLLRELASEPASRHGAELEMMRRGEPRHGVSWPIRARRMALLAVGLVLALAMSRYLYSG